MSLYDKSLARFEEMLADAALCDRQQWAAIEVLLDILEHAGITNEGHRRLLTRIKRSRPTEQRVRLAMYDDKYTMAGADIDCVSRLHLCHGRCCSFAIELSRQDLEEGELRWKIDQPYMMVREEDGYCTYLDRATGGCTTYHNRPGVCRKYDCREDQRVWKDFDAMIPADMPDTVLSFPGEPE